MLCSCNRSSKIEYSIEPERIIRDSIYIVKDSIQKKIIYLDKEYKEKVEEILSSSDSTNLQFFIEYINNYNK